MINLNILTNEKLTELLKIAYRWGRDNGSNRSEKNFNDFLQIEAVQQALSITDVVGRSEQLPILDRCGCEEPNEEPIKVCMNCNGYVE